MAASFKSFVVYISQEFGEWAMATVWMQVRKLNTDFLEGEAGSVTAEAVMWMPVFALLLGLIVDTSLMFGSQAEALRVVQDANRSLSVGRIMSVDDAEAYILSSINNMSPNASVETTVVNGVISSTLSMPAADITATGMFSGFNTLNVRVTAQHMSEA